MKSRCARYVLSRSRREWSRTEGYRELNWLTISQTAVELSLRHYFRILWTGKPEKLFKSIFDSEEEELITLKNFEIEKMTKLAKKTWRVRVLRYAKKVPPYFFSLDPFSIMFKIELKAWIRINIHKDGDYIFSGKAEPIEDDWLVLELNQWKQREDHLMESLGESQNLWDREGEG